MENKEEEEENQLRRFGQHCQHFYNSSLVLRPSSSSLSSIQEEKKADDKYHVGGDDNDMKKKHADGKIVLEALDRINTIRSIASDQPVTNTTLQNLRQEHTLMAEQHHSILLECGLLYIDRFTAHSAGHQRDVATSLLQRYIQVRDQTRRRAHKVSMLHRQNSLFGLLSTVSDMHGSSSTSITTKSRLTQIENIQHTISLVQKFVNKYQSNIGSHPFLAGLYRIIDLQLNPKSGSKYSNKDASYVIQWNFHGTVLTEASRSCQSKHHNENEYDELAYAREAIEVLFSFLIWIKDDIDLEGGVQNKLLVLPTDEANDSAMLEILNNDNKTSIEEETDESILSFEIDKFISNRSLQRILSVLPDPKRLDARATGSVKLLEYSNNDNSQRMNVDGQEDDHWPWFARFEFCTLL